MSVWRRCIEIILSCSWNTIHGFGWVLKTKKLSGKSDNKWQDFKTKYGNNPIESQIFKQGQLKGNVQPDSS